VFPVIIVIVFRRWRWRIVRLFFVVIVAAGRAIKVTRFGTFAARNMDVTGGEGWFRSFAITAWNSSNDVRHRDNATKERGPPHDDNRLELDLWVGEFSVL
jgi:hypothetical protein